MSYYTRLELQWDDSDEQGFDEEAIVERVRGFLNEQDISEDVLDDLRAALEGPLHSGVGFNRMPCELIVEMLRYLSRGFPETRFLARGTGEELLDVWLRELKNGETTLAHGPFDSQDRAG